MRKACLDDPEILAFQREHLKLYWIVTDRALLADARSCAAIDALLDVNDDVQRGRVAKGKDADAKATREVMRAFASTRRRWWSERGGKRGGRKEGGGVSPSQLVQLLDCGEQRVHVGHEGVHVGLTDAFECLAPQVANGVEVERVHPPVGTHALHAPYDLARDALNATHHVFGHHGGHAPERRAPLGVLELLGVHGSVPSTGTSSRSVASSTPSWHRT